VTRFVEDKHEGLLLCHESVAAIDDMCSVHSFCTRLWNVCPELMISKGTAAVSQKLLGSDNKNQATHQQFDYSKFTSADDSDQSRFNVEMRVEIEKSRN
jgi:hypothetical protein